MDNNWTTKKVDELRKMMPEVFDEAGKLNLNQLVAQLGIENINRDESPTVEDNRSAAPENASQREAYRMAFQQNPHPVFIYDCETLAFLEVNETAIAVYGYTRDEFLNLSIRDIHPIEDLPLLMEKIQSLTHQGLDPQRITHLKKKGEILHVEISAHSITYNGRKARHAVITDVTDRVEAEKYLLESEKSISRKLKALLTPNSDLGAFDLADLLDFETLQALIDEFHNMLNIGIGILDLNGEIILSTGWQDICTNYHRINPNTLRKCSESNCALTLGLLKGEFKLAKCQNNLWDMATPIVIEGRTVGNIILGQFSLEEEELDINLFKAQAAENHFDEKAYLEALSRAPRFSRNTVEAAMKFYAKFGDIISVMAINNIKLARTINEKDQLLKDICISEEKFRLLATNSTDVIWTMDLTGNFIYISPSLEKLIGYTPEEKFEQRFNEMLTPESTLYVETILLEKVTSIMSGIKPEPIKIEVELFCKDGTTIWTEVHVSTICNNKNEFVYFIGNARNIDVQKKAIKSLKDSEIRFRRLLQDIKSVSVQGYAPDGTTTYWNDGSELLYGYTAEEAIGKSLLDLIIPSEMQDGVRQAIIWMEDTGEAIPPAELKLRKKDGTLVSVFSHHTIVKTEGQPQELFCIDVDLTAQTHALEALKKSEQNLRKIINEFSVPMAINDSKQNIIFLNDSFTNTFGYTIDDIPNLAAWWSLAYPDAEYRRFIKEVWQTELEESHRLGKKFFPTEANIRCKNGENKVAIASAMETDNGDELIDLIVLFDITDRKKAEDELAESRAKYKGLSNAAFESIFVSENGICIEQNKTAEITFGYSLEEALGRYGTDWIVEEDRDMVMRNMMQGFEEPYEATALKKDGSTFPCLLRGRMMRYKNKDVRITSLTDISLLKKTQIELIESKAQLSAIIDNEPECIKIVNNIGQLTFMNIAGLAMIEADSFEQVQGNDVVKFVAPQYREEFSQMHNKVLTGGTHHMEFEMVGIKGTHRWLETHAVPITINGKVSQLAITRDITEQKMMMEALAESEKRYKALYDASPTGIIMLDKNGIIQEINKEITKITLFSRDELIGESILKLSTHDKWPLIKSNIKRILSGEFLESEVETVKKDGSLAFFHLREIAIKLPNGEQGILSVSNDITDRKKAEEELNEKMDELMRFHRLTVGRELMMIELKKEINELLKKAGLHEKYVIAG